MTVISCEDALAQRRGKVEVKGNKTQREYSRSFLALANDEFDDEVTILNDLRIPRLGDSHESDLKAVVKSIEVTRDAEPMRPAGVDIWKWMIDVQYTTDKDAHNPRPVYPDTPPKRSYSWDKKEIAIDRDRDDKPVVNTAFDPYDPPIVVEFPIPIKTIKINLPDGWFTPAWMNQYFMAINAEEYDGWEAGQVLIQDIQSSEEEYTDPNTDEEIPYWAVTIKMAYNLFGWQPDVLSQGFRELRVPEGGAPEDPKMSYLITTEDGHEVTTPVPLDEDGKALFGSAVATGAHYTKYTIYREMSFADFEF